MLGVDFCALQLNALKDGLQFLNHYFSHLLGTWQTHHHYWFLGWLPEPGGCFVTEQGLLLCRRAPMPFWSTGPTAGSSTERYMLAPELRWLRSPQQKAGLEQSALQGRSPEACLGTK